MRPSPKTNRNRFRSLLHILLPNPNQQSWIIFLPALLHRVENRDPRETFTLTLIFKPPTYHNGSGPMPNVAHGSTQCVLSTLITAKKMPIHKPLDSRVWEYTYTPEIVMDGLRRWARKMEHRCTICLSVRHLSLELSARYWISRAEEDVERRHLVWSGVRGPKAVECI